MGEIAVEGPYASGGVTGPSAACGAVRTSQVRVLDASVAVLPLLGVLALFFTGGIPARQPEDDAEVEA